MPTPTPVPTPAPVPTPCQDKDSADARADADAWSVGAGQGQELLRGQGRRGPGAAPGFEVRHDLPGAVPEHAQRTAVPPEHLYVPSLV